MSVLKNALWTQAEYKQRPRTPTPEMIEEILARLENGESLRSICDNRDLPFRGTFLRWTEEDPELLARYDRARQVQADLMVDDLIDIGEDPDVQRGHLRLKVRERATDLLNPTKYGRTRGTPPAGPAAETPSGDAVAELRARIRRVTERGPSPGVRAEGPGADGPDPHLPSSTPS